MQLSEQVITLEQARKLKELWFEKPSIFSYYEEHWIRLTQEWPYRLYYMLTASELIDILPAYLSPFELFIKKQLDDTYKVWYIRWYWENENDKSYESSYIIYNTNLAQALWDMLIYLIENNLFPVKQ